MCPNGCACRAAAAQSKLVVRLAVWPAGCMAGWLAGASGRAAHPGWLLGRQWAPPAARCWAAPRPCTQAGMGVHTGHPTAAELICVQRPAEHPYNKWQGTAGRHRDGSYAPGCANSSCPLGWHLLLLLPQPTQTAGQQDAAKGLSQLRILPRSRPARHGGVHAACRSCMPPACEGNAMRTCQGCTAPSSRAPSAGLKDARVLSKGFVGV